MATKLNDILVSLKSIDESERCYAVEDLLEAKDSSVIPYLIEALEDSSVRVREAVIDGLSQYGGAEVAEAVAPLLESEQSTIRNGALEILEKLGVSALPVLEKQTHSLSRDVRKFATDTIGKLIHLLDTANDLSNDLRSKLIATLGELLNDKDINVAASAAEALGMTKDDSVILMLLKYFSIQKQASWLQCNVIVALSRIGSEKASEGLRNINQSQISAEAKIYLEMALRGESL